MPPNSTKLSCPVEAASATGTLGQAGGQSKPLVRRLDPDQACMGWAPARDFAAITAKTAEVMVRKDTVFKFDTFRHEDAKKLESTLLNVDEGSILIKAQKLVGDSKFQVKTPTSIVGIRGTVFEVSVPKA